MDQSLLQGTREVGSMNSFRSQCPYSRWGVFLGIYPVGPMAALGILHGAVSAGTLSSRGTRPGGEGAGRLTYIADRKSVSPLRSLAPAAHSGGGPIIEASWISVGEKRVDNLEGVGQGTDPLPTNVIS